VTEEKAGASGGRIEASRQVLKNWPQVCACCLEPGQTSITCNATQDVTTYSGPSENRMTRSDEVEVPFCNDCRTHIQKFEENRGIGMIWLGCLGAIVIAFGGVLFAELYLGLEKGMHDIADNFGGIAAILGVSLGVFTVVRYMIFKYRETQELEKKGVLKPECASMSNPVLFPAMQGALSLDGSFSDCVIIEFRNSKYMDLFIQRNKESITKIKRFKI